MHRMMEIIPGNLGNVTGIAYARSREDNLGVAENLARAAGKVESLAMVEADMARGWP